MKALIFRLTGAVASGVLLALAFPPFEHSWAAWISLVPLFLSLASQAWCVPPSVPPTPRQRAFTAFFLGYLTGSIFFLVSLSWVITVTGLGWVVFCLYLALYPGVWSFIVDQLLPRPGLHPSESRGVLEWTQPYLHSRSNILLALLCAAAWVSLEWVRGTLFSGFGWNTLAVSQVQNLPLIQIAEFTGQSGISFLLVMASVIFAVTIIRLVGEASARRVRPHFDFTLTVLITVFVFLFGLHTLWQPKPTTATPLRVSIVQPNIPLSEQRNPDSLTRILDTFYRLSAVAAATDPDLVVWPESAIPGGLLLHRENWDFTMDVLALGRFSLLTGTLDAQGEGEFNAATLVSPYGTEPQLYHKLHLVPFGEYVPFRSTFPVFAWVVGDQVPDDFDAGKAPVVFQLVQPRLALAPLICFEDTLGDLTRRFVGAGADALVNVTNDAWFLESHASRQHLQNAIFRTIENRRPLIRAANTGVSAIVDVHGRIDSILSDENGGTFTQGTLFSTVPVLAGAPTTFYTRHGEVFALGCLAISVCSVFLRSCRRPARSSRPGGMPCAIPTMPRSESE